jgi:hypothetical protein
VSAKQKIVRVCPVCDCKTLVAHCDDDHPTCPWHVCRSQKCGVTLDPMRGHGYRVGGTGEWERVIL